MEDINSEQKRILLMYPPSPVMNREERCQQPTKDLIVIPPLPPTDLMYLAAIAEQAGCLAKIADYSLGGNLVDDLNEFKPDYVLANVATPTLKSDLDSLKLVKDIFPDAITIAKGAPFLTYNTNAIYECKFLDYAIVGESEYVLRDILNGVENSEIRGICYRDGYVAKFTGRSPFIKDLDELPFPARHLVDNNLYRRPDNNKVQAVIKVSRGCPYHCFFCMATPVSGAEVRRRSPENIVKEIQLCINRYGIRDFIFWSDIFNADNDWVKDLCNEIIKNKLDITWSANTRADTADIQTVELMYKAGCRLVSLGAESGSQFILNKIGKRITLDDIKHTVRIFKKNKIKIYGYFVIGLPWDDEDTIEETIKFAINLNTDFVSFYTATPLPGTKFAEFVNEEHLADDNDSFNDAYYVPTVKTMYLSKERVFELHKKAVKRYYLRPNYILKMLLGIRSLEELKNYFRAGINLLLKK